MYELLRLMCYRRIQSVYRSEYWGAEVVNIPCASGYETCRVIYIILFCFDNNCIWLRVGSTLELQAKYCIDVVFLI